jgi:hypothetical protein
MAKILFEMPELLNLNGSAFMDGANFSEDVGNGCSVGVQMAAPMTVTKAVVNQ